MIGLGQIKTAAIASALTAAIAFSMGWAVQGWRLNGKAAKQKVERLETSLMSATESARIAREGQTVTNGINATLRASLDTLNGNVGTMAQANAALAQSRAPRVETIYRQAETFANDTFDPNSCPRQSVDYRLLDYIWPTDAPSAARLRLAGGSGSTG